MRAQHDQTMNGLFKEQGNISQVAHHQGIVDVGVHIPHHEDGRYFILKGLDLIEGGDNALGAFGLHARHILQPLSGRPHSKAPVALLQM